MRRWGLIAIGVLIFVPCAVAQRTVVKPPWNVFSSKTDIKEGKLYAVRVQEQLPLCNDAKVDAYLTKLGFTLVGKLPTGGVAYPFEFHCVNDKQINAYALPGGYVFINRGAIEAADNEAQLAAVMAHELSHVALRHGTAQASKALFAQGAATIFGAIFGGSAGGALLTQGVALGAGSALLHYSRDAETQADVLGTQVLFDSGYDPRALAQFFEKLEAETKGKNPPEFFSDHPNPDNRLARVGDEVQKLGGASANARRDSPEFAAIKREVLALPVVAKSGRPVFASSAGPPPAPSAELSAYRGKAYTLRYPRNWKNYSDTTGGATLAPDGGMIQSIDGNAGVAYGLILGNQAASKDAPAADALQRSTEELISGLKKSNRNMKITRPAARVRVNGEPALSTYLSNDSPAGGSETDWILTVMRPSGLEYFVFVAPEKSYAEYDKTFAAILDSVQFTK